MSFRKITLLGNVGKDPEIRTVGDSQVASFGVAVTDKWTDKSGERKEKTTWFNISVWQSGANGLVKSVVQPYVKKGSMVFIDGTPEIQEYEKDGVKQRSFNVRVGGPGSTLRLCGQPNGNGGAKPAAAADPAPADNNDDIPF